MDYENGGNITIYHIQISYSCLPLFTHKQYKYCVVYTKGAFKCYVWANHYSHLNNISECEINIVVNQVEA